MRQDFLLSFLLHFVVVVAMIISAPFRPHVKTDFGDVIKVNLRSIPPSAAKPSSEKISIPAPQISDRPPVPVAEVAAKTKAKPINKPKPKPEKKKNDTYQPDAEKGKTDQTGLPDGQKDVSENLGTGSKFGGAAIDDASFDYPYWFVQAFDKIERNWSNPIYANQPLSCIIYFQVIRSGRIIKIEIEKSSGVDAFDRACERAMNLSQPLPPLPDQFTEEIIGIHLEFPYAPGQ